MCNAKNHQPDCPCGFGVSGGIKFLFGMQKSLRFDGVESITYPHVASHTPNAKCPSCSEPVFFYKNEHGSAVFFDELGPPWPKHPCTDSSKHVPFVESLPKASKAESQGWGPAELIDASRLKGGEVYEFQCRSKNGKSVNLFISASEVEKKANLQVLSNEDICFLKQVSQQVYSISLLSTEMKILNSKAYLDISDVQKNKL